MGNPFVYETDKNDIFEVIDCRVDMIFLKFRKIKITKNHITALLLIIEVIMKDIDSIAKIFSEEDNLFLIDHYPFVVSDNDKYSQIEYDFKVMSAKRHKRKQMVSAISDFFELLWLYSDTKVYIFNTIKNMNRKNSNDNQMVLVDNIKQLKKIVRMRMMNKYNAFFVFEKFRGGFDIYVYLDDVFASVYFTDSVQVSYIEKIASHCGLFIRRQEEFQSISNTVQNGGYIDAEGKT